MDCPRRYDYESRRDARLPNLLATVTPPCSLKKKSAVCRKDDLTSATSASETKEQLSHSHELFSAFFISVSLSLFSEQDSSLYTFCMISRIFKEKYRSTTSLIYFAIVFF